MKSVLVISAVLVAVLVSLAEGKPYYTFPGDRPFTNFYGNIGGGFTHHPYGGYGLGEGYPHYPLAYGGYGNGRSYAVETVVPGGVYGFDGCGCDGYGKYGCNC